MCPELAHIQVAAVLYAPVRMVDQPFGIVPARLCDGRPEGFQREEGAERGGKRPACYLVGMAVGHQMQAAASPVRVDVGYGAYLQTVCRIRGVVIYELTFIYRICFLVYTYTLPQTMGVRSSKPIRRARRYHTGYVWQRNFYNGL